MLFTNPIPKIVRNAAIRTRLGSAAADDRRADRDPRATLEVPEQDTERQRGKECDPERRAGELDLLERLRSRNAGWSPMKRNASTNVCRFAASATIIEPALVHGTAVRRMRRTAGRR